MAVSRLSPVTIRTVTPADLHVLTAFAMPTLKGS